MRSDKLRESGEWDVGIGRQDAKGVFTIALAFLFGGNRCDRWRPALRDELGKAISQRVDTATDQMGECFAGQVGVVRTDAIGVRLRALFRKTRKGVTDGRQLIARLLKHRMTIHLPSRSTG
ncbi:hypothetical protein DBA20_18730 [Pandoraea capi]|nr:hypothetical protein [Pandoraea sp. LA3]MDN4585011.1 hypothetical protein [Pandoraea capi]